MSVSDEPVADLVDSDDEYGIGCLNFTALGESLGHAARFGDTEDVIEILAQAMSYGSRKLPKDVLECPTEDDRNLYTKLTPLQHAAEGGHVKIVELLLQAGADIHNSDDRFITPLHLAAAGGHTETAALLIARGAHLEIPSLCGYSPLHYAVMHDRDTTTELLVACGANIDDCQPISGSPLDVAYRHGINTVAVLLSAGPDSITRRKTQQPRAARCKEIAQEWLLTYSERLAPDQTETDTVFLT